MTAPTTIPPEVMQVYREQCAAEFLAELEEAVASGMLTPDDVVELARLAEMRRGEV
jgi:hypothetical protein